MLVHNFLQNSAQKYPYKNAVWYKNQWMTFSEIDSLSNKIANYLLESGIRRGDRVAILLENSFDYIVSYYAILKSGGCTVALNTETTKELLTYYLNDSGAKAIISRKIFSKYLIPALTKSPYLKDVIIDQDDLSEYEEIAHCNQSRLKDIYQHGNDKSTSVRSIDLDLASLVYTSGSTGKPKGVMLTHLNIVSNTHSIVEYLQLTSRDKIMVVLPFYYIYGKSLLNTHFYRSGSVVIENRFAFPNVVLDTMKKTRVTGFAGVPSTFMILLNKSTIKNEKFKTLRYVTQAGGAMAPSIQNEVAKVFHPAQLFIMYGATEASARLSYLDPNDFPRKCGSIGKAISNVDLFIADEKGNPLLPDQEGEIVARGSNIMQGYWNDLKATAEVLRDGLYWSGDIGKMDEEGFLYVVGRSKDMIKVGGERVSAKEIEEALLELKELNEVAVIGVEDELMGEAIKAYIVLGTGNNFDQNKIKNFCKKRLPAFKNPKFIEIVENLPKNKSGKIMKTELKKRHLQENMNS